MPRTLERDALLADLDASQHEAVTSPHRPLAILAGAGSGKTRVLTRRIAWQAREGELDPARVLAVTFTRKAAGELATRLARLGVEQQVTAGTLHAVALAQLRRRQDDRGRAMPGLLERKARLLAPLVGGRGPAAALAAGEVATEIEWAKAQLLAPEAYAAAVARAGRTPPRPADELASLYTRYEREKRRRGLVDFDDLVWWCADALEGDPEFAAAQRWRFRHVFVDEFQDVGPAQLRLIRAWLGDRPDLCVVGDPDQSIYRFAGAEPGYLTRFAHHFPGGHVVRLACNYRSSPRILAAATALLADGAGRPATMRSTRPDGPVPTITAYPTDRDEATAVARALTAAHSPERPWSSMAVLYRTNAQSEPFEEALSRAAIPYRVRGAGRFLERPEVRVALDALRTGAARSPGLVFADHLADLEAEAAEAPEERREHADALVRLGREYLTVDGGAGSVDGFLTFLGAALRDDAGERTGDAVELLTFHRAKGLEFHTVFVTGLERGLVPIVHAADGADRAEERRLLYVALTRAERELHLSWARERARGSRTSRRAPSPWLAPIEAALAPDPGQATGRRPGSSGGSPPRGAADARTVLERARDRRTAPDGHHDDDPPPDPHLLAALVEWRRNLARSSGVPAYVIFHDATLRAVAATRPASTDALLGLAGIGPVKAERYGPAVLEVVARHPG